MSRYLTPSKIGLLALVSLYTESVVPSAATIPVLSFLVSHILPVSRANDPTQQPCRTVLTVDDLQKATISQVSGIPGRTVWDLLLNKLWKINSFDALHLFFDSLSSMLQKTPEEQQRDPQEGIDPQPHRIRLSRVSPIGSFVRRAQLEFTRLQFHDGVSLWKNFIAYRASTLPQWKKRNPAAGTISFDSNLQEGDVDLRHRLTNVIYGEHLRGLGQHPSVSAEDVERLLDFQLDQMQSMTVPS